MSEKKVTLNKINWMDISKLLSAKQIKERLDIFNETNDWSVFDDVPKEQHYAIMYPYSITKLAFNSMMQKAFVEKLTETRKNGKTRTHTD
jgi:hypothetical protein